MRQVIIESGKVPAIWNDDTLRNALHEKGVQRIEAARKELRQAEEYYEVMYGKKYEGK